MCELGGLEEAAIQGSGRIKMGSDEISVGFRRFQRSFGKFHETYIDVSRGAMGMGLGNSREVSMGCRVFFFSNSFKRTSRSFRGFNGFQG